MKKTLGLQLAAVLIGAVTFAWVLGGCAATAGREAGQGAGGAVRIGPDTLSGICGMEWVLETFTLDGQAVPLETERPHVRFEPDGKLGGSGSVNRFFGHLSFDDKGRIQLSPLGTTMMAGPENLMAQESRFMKGFGSIRELTLSEGRLEGTSEDGKTALVFRSGVL